jgi:hypothetical protein
MESFTQFGDTQFAIRCQTQNKYYKEFEEDFLKIVNSLMVIKPSVI